MRELAQHICFLLKTRCSCCKLSRIQVGLAHLFDGDAAMPKTSIHCHVDGSHAAPAYLTKNHIALLKQGMWRKSACLVVSGHSAPHALFFMYDILPLV